MAKESPYIIPVPFADENDDHGEIPFTGHAGMILAEPNGHARYFEYDPGGAKAWAQVGGSTVYSGAHSSLRQLVLPNDLSFDSNENPTEASIETTLSKITSSLYGKGDPGMIFATPDAISRPEFNHVEDYIYNMTKQIEHGEDRYHEFSNNCLNLVYHAADAGDVRVSSSQNKTGLAWPAEAVASLLRESGTGFEYTAPNSKHGESIQEVNLSDYRTPKYSADRFHQLVRAGKTGLDDLYALGSDLLDDLSAPYHAVDSFLDRALFGGSSDAFGDRTSEATRPMPFYDLLTGARSAQAANGASRPQDFETMLKDMGLARLPEGDAVARAPAHSLDFEPFSSALAGYASSHPSPLRGIDGAHGAEDLVAPGDERTPLGQEAAKWDAALRREKGSGAGLDAFDRESRQPTESQFAAESLFQQGLLQRKLMELGAIRQPSELGADGQSHFGNLGGNALDGQVLSMLPEARGASNNLVHHDDWTTSLGRRDELLNRDFDKDEHGAMGKGSLAPAVDHSLEKESFQGFNGRFSGRSGTDAQFGTFGVIDGSASADAPGWIVALASALGAELVRSGHYNNGGMPGGPTASRQSQLTPSGTRNDPMHVRVVEQSMAYQSHMPSGSTASLPSQSLPVPGQVLFAP